MRVNAHVHLCSRDTDVSYTQTQRRATKDAKYMPFVTIMHQTVSIFTPHPDPADLNGDLR
jgi:hypothetical protein